MGRRYDFDHIIRLSHVLIKLYEEHIKIHVESRYLTSNITYAVTYHEIHRGTVYNYRR